MARDFHDPKKIDTWLQSLDERWPSRAEIAQHIVAHIDALAVFDPQVVELAPGDGQLAAKLLHTLPATYTGIDFSTPLLERARTRLARYGERVQLIQADLNQDEWPAQIASPVDAVFSMQSLHDLGDGHQVQRIYQRVLELLTPSGRLLNADLLHNPADPRPGRLTTERHIELMLACGYQRAECTLETGGFGCIAGYA